jgi:hypothetical protein
MLISGLPDGIYFMPKIPILLYFGRLCNGTFWYILWPFGIFYGPLVYFMALWYMLIYELLSYFPLLWYVVQIALIFCNHPTYT